MTDIETFGLLVLIAACVGLAGVLSNRVSERLRIPAPAIFLICAAVASDLIPGLQQAIPITTVEQIVTVALAIILFDGGMGIGWKRFRSAAGPIVWLGVVGTFVTTGAVAVLGHFVFGFRWVLALLLGTALAPTDPAVVFSVLGRREVSGRSGTILEGESGANDPVGIALMVSLIAAAGTGKSISAGPILLEFVIQMIVGGAVGFGGGILLVAFMRRVPLPSEGLYSLRVLASALALYGAATIAHGSGFLAVFVAGIVIGDEGAPYKREIERFHSSLASLAEIVAFIVLGLTVGLYTLPRGNSWITGLVLAALLGFVVRPLLVGLLMLPIKMDWGERGFVLWSGLKGAVPILLGAFVITGGVTGAQTIYNVVFVVVAFSVIVQGGLVPAVAGLLRVPMRTVEPEPWAVGVRFHDQPQGIHRYVVATGAPADGCAIRDLGLSEDIWISFVIRHGQLVQVRAATELQAGDEVLALSDQEDAAARLSEILTEPSTDSTARS
jgi:cell volume regulation protein A